MTQWICFREKKTKEDEEQKEEGGGNLHHSPIRRDELGKSQRIAVLWR